MWIFVNKQINSNSAQTNSLVDLKNNFSRVFETVISKTDIYQISLKPLHYFDARFNFQSAKFCIEMFKKIQNRPKKVSYMIFLVGFRFIRG